VQLVHKQLRTFETSSVGRLFDTAAALLGFTHEITFEGQAAIWLEQVARAASPSLPYPFPFADNTLDFRPLLAELIRDRVRGRDPGEIARAFHAGVAHGLWQGAKQLCEANSIDLVVLSGGVFQNELLLTEIAECAHQNGLEIWVNTAVPANDGGISLGQAASAVVHELNPGSASTCE
jgi:hydrogenase maturation protein HypF